MREQKPEAPLSFREWLIQKLSTTRAIRLTLDDAGIEEQAVKLGVQPDVLREARVVYVLRQAEEGRGGPLGRKRAGSRHYQLRLYMPPEIHALWVEECASRALAGSVVLRSVLHHYLLADREPTRLAGGWRYRARTFVTEHKTRREERALIPRGAREALARRAQRLGVAPASILRALVLEVLDGEHRRVLPIDSISMYDDPSRYMRS